jgi:hypothetical protein
MTRTRITTDGLADSSVTTPKIADSSITTAKIAPGAVVEADLADSSVTTSKIASGAVTAAKVTLVPADIGAAQASHTHPSTEISDSTTAGRALMTAADAAAQRTSLGLGTMAQATATDYLARAGGTMTGQLVALAGNAGAPGVAISGDTDTGIMQAASSPNTLSVATNGVERWRVGADGATQSVIPGGSTLLPQFQCRAWVNFNGTGTPAIRASGNVTSVSRVATGDYMINFSTAMPDTNFAGVGGCSGIAGTTFGGRLECVPWAVGQLRVLAVNGPGSATYDSGIVQAAVFR